MAGSNPPRQAMWREAFAALKRTQKIWQPWTVGFIVLAVVANYFMLHDQLLQIQTRVHEVHDKLQPMVMQPPSASSLLGQFCSSLLQLFAYYFFTVLYLQQEPITKKPQASVGGFFYWLGQILLKFIAILGQALIVLVPGFALAHFVPAVKGPLTSVTILLGLGVAIHASVKYMIVGPLAISKIKPVLNTSWRLTNDNWWRLLGQALIYSFLCWLVLVVIFVVCAVSGFWIRHAGLGFPILAWGFSIAISLYSLILCVAMPVFVCTACRTLYQEQQSAKHR